MGGSGGGYFRGGGDPGDLARRLRDTEAEARDEGYETSVNQQLGEFLKDFNSRDAAGTREVLEDVKNELADEIGGTVDLVYGGSVSRHTYLEGLSDTDALVIIDPDDVGRKSPERLKDRFAQRLRELFGNDNVRVGDLAVTVTVRGKEVQLLPAMRDGEGYRIAAPDGRSWSKINPRAFAEKLTQANKRKKESSSLRSRSRRPSSPRFQSNNNSPATTLSLWQSRPSRTTKGSEPIRPWSPISLTGQQNW